jgi:hypothetical protein
LQINPIAILATPLSISLTSLDKQNSFLSSSNDEIQMGYLTLNQTRKIVLLLQDDTCIVNTPIVGLWLLFGDQNNSDKLNESCCLNHPYSFGAYIRFFFNENIKNKIFVDNDTFLVVSFFLVLLFVIVIISVDKFNEFNNYN